VSYDLSDSALFPVAPEVAFQALVDAPLEVLFPGRSGLIPPIRGCEGQEGAWGHIGQTRTVVLADGSRNLETLVAVERPGDYRYVLSDFTGPMRLLVGTVDGRFAFVAEGDGTRVTWSWALHPRTPLTRLVLPLLGFSWRTMARTMWPRLGARLAS